MALLGTSQIPPAHAVQEHLLDEHVKQPLISVSISDLFLLLGGLKDC